MMKALKDKKDIIFRNMEKCSNELFFILKQIIEKNSFFSTIKQEIINFKSLPKLFFIFNNSTTNNDIIFNFLKSNTYAFAVPDYTINEKILISLSYSSKLKFFEDLMYKLNFLKLYLTDALKEKEFTPNIEKDSSEENENKENLEEKNKQSRFLKYSFDVSLTEEKNIFNFLNSKNFIKPYNNYNEDRKLSYSFLENLIASANYTNKKIEQNNVDVGENKIFCYMKEFVSNSFIKKLLEIYESIIKKYRFNSRLRNITIQDMIRFCTRTDFILNDIFSDFEIRMLNIEKTMFKKVKSFLNKLETKDSNQVNIDNFFQEEISYLFISEKNKMKIISNFIYINFLSLDDAKQLNLIADEFAQYFNFESNYFKNYITNFNDLVNESNSTYAFLKNFEKKNISFDNLISKKSMYSYNSITKFYTKIINESILNNENILLVGETGVGKTTMIQNLAKIMDTKLNVINLSQSSDSSELFGGFKPVHPKIFLQKYFNAITDIFLTNFNENENKSFLESFYKVYHEKECDYFIKFTLKSLEKIIPKLEEKMLNKHYTKKEILKKNLYELNNIYNEIIKFRNAIKKGNYNAFTYMDGILLEAIKKDEWILLDEINLAGDDLLLKLNSILEGEDIFLVENNELKVYKRGPKFRIFGSMNPEYNVGKKRLPIELRNLFTEFFIPEIKEFHDIKTLVKTYVGDYLDDKLITEISKFYMFIKEKQNLNQIYKANSSKSAFSLRNLSRTLLSIRSAIEFYDSQTSITEAFEMNFFSQLSEESIILLKDKFSNSIAFRFSKNEGENKINKSNIKLSFDKQNSFYNIDNYFVFKDFVDPNFIDPEIDKKFILTKSFKKHFLNLMRIVTLSNYAVLLEGPTSCGKTSVIEYIGKKIGQKVLRINNNQNTEVEEYIGNYTSDSKGQFYFQEGFLVKAVKEGYWIILDEINLAPSEVLEALNRLLDDNRELYISETNTVIKAHPNFKIFAAMNPAESYGGRKDLSEAFKNRFIYIYFDNIPEEDLEEIIEKRCKLAKSRVKMMVSIFKDLQKIRSSEKVFSRKEGFMTIRDLIKWGSRQINDYIDLAYEGFFVIAEKIRSEEEKLTIKKVIEKYLFKHTKQHLDFDKYYFNYCQKVFSVCFDNKKMKEIYKNQIHLNKSTMRLLTLIDKSIKNKEPVLLIGETGCGKTIISEFLAEYYNLKMRTISCHENLDISDFLGSLRSVYGREEKMNAIKKMIYSIFEKLNKPIFNIPESQIPFSLISDITNGLNNIGLNYSNQEVALFFNEKIKYESIVLGMYFEYYSKLSSENNKSSNLKINFDNYIQQFEEFKNIFITDSIDSHDIIIMDQKINKIKISNLVADKINILLKDHIFKFLSLDQKELRDLLNLTTRTIFKNEIFIKNEKLILDNMATFKNMFFIESQKVIENSYEELSTNIYNNIIINLLENHNYFDNLLIVIKNESNTFNNLTPLIEESHKIFEWIDGPLTESMKKGEMLLIDEISLALDSVLERMNSVFEADRILILSEKQTHHLGGNVETIIPRESFAVIASMSPAGDHGKRELSPALRSRFSEIYIDSQNYENELKDISHIININFEKKDFTILKTSHINLTIFNQSLADNQKILVNQDIVDLHSFDTFKMILFKIKNCDHNIWNNIIKEQQLDLLELEIIFAHLIFSFYCWYNYWLIKNQSQIIKLITLRDVELIIEFMFLNVDKIITRLDFIKFYNHSIEMLIIDGIFLNESSKPESLIYIRTKISEFLNYQLKFLEGFLLPDFKNLSYINHKYLHNYQLKDNDVTFGVNPFILNKINPNKIDISSMDIDTSNDNNRYNNKNSMKKNSFIFSSDNIKENLLKILRGLSTKKPILIEGSPGVGKTTIIQNIAKKINKNIYRINLSEHTDMIDLIGSDFPIDDGNSSSGIVFKWIEGVFLKAMINGDWIIIDEMNLASQSILEGLNSVLDYRKSLYVSELNKEFKSHPDFQIFATQNPVNQGGGRKFLPKSFLNRFVKIYLNDLLKEDYQEILINLYPSLQSHIIEKLTCFNYECQKIIFGKYKLNMNEVGEFNLRTLTKVLDYSITLNPRDQEHVDFLNDSFLFKKLAEIIKLNYLSRLRKYEVKKEIKKIFFDIFNIKFSSQKISQNHLVELKNPDEESINHTNGKICYLENYQNNIFETSIFSKYINQISLCIKNNYPIILTGDSGIGKKEIIRHIAKKTKNNLYEFCLNSSMDSTELLGNYDKINLSYHLKIIKEELNKYAYYILNKFCEDKYQTYEKLMNASDYLDKKVIHYYNIYSENQIKIKKNLNLDNDLSEKFNISILKKNFEVLIDKFKSIGLILSNEKILKRVIDFIETESFNFEWHDSSLIRCIEKGNWIILDNVNTCSAAVLDRLNSLLDDDKQIYLNECGSTEPRIIKAHKNFRIFLVMNDKFGEVSRALKNRCVEIYFMKDLMNVNFKYGTIHDPKEINIQEHDKYSNDELKPKRGNNQLNNTTNHINYNNQRIVLEDFKFKISHDSKISTYKFCINVFNVDKSSEKAIKFSIKSKILQDFILIANKHLFSYRKSFVVVTTYLLTNILFVKNVADKIFIFEDNNFSEKNKNNISHNKSHLDYRLFNKFIKILSFYIQKESNISNNLISKYIEKDSILIIKSLIKTVRLLFISDQENSLYFNKYFLIDMIEKVSRYFDFNDVDPIISQFNLFGNFNNIKNKFNQHNSKKIYKNSLAPELINRKSINNDIQKILFNLDFSDFSTKYFNFRAASENGKILKASENILENKDLRVNNLNKFILKLLIQKNIISIINQIEKFKLKLNNQISTDKNLKNLIEAVYDTNINILNLNLNESHKSKYSLKHEVENNLLPTLRSFLSCGLVIFSSVSLRKKSYNLTEKSTFFSWSNRIIQKFLELEKYIDINIDDHDKLLNSISFVLKKIKLLLSYLDIQLKILTNIITEFLPFLLYTISVDFIKLISNDIGSTQAIKTLALELFNSINIEEFQNINNDPQADSFISFAKLNKLLNILTNEFSDQNLEILNEKRLAVIYKEFLFYNVQVIGIENQMKKIMTIQDENINKLITRLQDLCYDNNLEPINYYSLCSFINSILSIKNHHPSNSASYFKSNIKSSHEYILNFIKSNPETFFYLTHNIINNSLRIKEKLFKKMSKTSSSSKELSLVQDPHLAIKSSYNILNMNDSEMNEMKKLFTRKMNILFNLVNNESFNYNSKNMLPNEDYNLLTDSKNKHFLISDIIKILSFNSYIFSETFFEYNTNDHTINFNLLRKNNNLNQSYYTNSLLDNLHQRECIEKIKNSDNNEIILFDLNTLLNIPMEKNLEFYENFIKIVKNQDKTNNTSIKEEEQKNYLSSSLDHFKFNISIDSPITLKILSLEFEKKSVRITNDLITLKYFRSIFEKINEVLSNEHINLSIISNKDHMKGIFNFINNFVNFSDYLPNVRIFSPDKILSGDFLKYLIEKDFGRKINIKNLFDNNLLEYLIKNYLPEDKILGQVANESTKNFCSNVSNKKSHLLSNIILNLFIYGELNENILEKLLKKNKDAELIIEDLLQNQEKLLNSPFYYFYSKINCENILCALSNIPDIYNLDKRINLYLESLHSINSILFDDEHQEEILKDIILHPKSINSSEGEEDLRIISSTLIKLEILSRISIPEKEKISKILGKDILKMFYEENLINKKKYYFSIELNNHLDPFKTPLKSDNYICSFDNIKLNILNNQFYEEMSEENHDKKNFENGNAVKNIELIYLHDKLSKIKSGNYRGENYDAFLNDYKDILKIFFKLSDFTKPFLMNLHNYFEKFHSEKKIDYKKNSLNKKLLDFMEYIFYDTTDLSFLTSFLENINLIIDTNEEFIRKLKNFISKNINFFDDIFSPFTSYSLIFSFFISDILILMENFVKAKLNKIEHYPKNIKDCGLEAEIHVINESIENANVSQSNLLKLKKFTSVFKYLNYNLYQNKNEQKILMFALNKLQLLVGYLGSDEFKYNLQASNDSNNNINVIDFKERIKIYENINMKVMETTHTLDEYTKQEKEKMSDEIEIKEIEENFPNYSNHFENFEKLDLIQLQKNISIKDYYNKDKKKIDPEPNNIVKEKETFYALYKLLNNLFFNSSGKDFIDCTNNFNFYNSISNSYHNENFNDSELINEIKFWWIKDFEILFKNMMDQKNLNFSQYENYILKNNEILNINQDFEKKEYMCYGILERMYKFFKIFTHEKNDDISKDIDIKSYKFNNKSFNFYKDSNKKEMKNLFITLNKVLEKISFYLKEYEDHPLLVLMTIIISNLLELPNTTPLSKVISGLDILLNKLQEWETYASRKINSLQDEINSVMVLVRRLRKIEILSWKCFLNSKLEEYEKKDIEFFFENIINIFYEVEKYFDDKFNHLIHIQLPLRDLNELKNITDFQDYEILKNIINETFIQQIDDKINEILDTINLFVINSNISSFYFRIKSIKILSNLLKFSFSKKYNVNFDSDIFKNLNNKELLSKNGLKYLLEVILRYSNKTSFIDLAAYFLNLLINSLSNSYSYYEINFIFNNKFEEFSNLQINEVEEKVKNLTQIAKWDIKNYFNFRDNMKRNYKQLNKVLKKFDNFCLTTFKQFIEYSSRDFIDKEYVYKFIQQTSLEKEKEHNLAKEIDNKSNKANYENMSFVNIFENMNEEIITRLTSLKKLSLSTKSKVFKHKALIDLIKTLKNFGFNSTYRFYQKEVYDIFKIFDINFFERQSEKYSNLSMTVKELTKHSHVNPSNIEVEYIDKINKCGGYICKILEKINHFNLVEIISEDLNKKYLETMRGLSYSLFFKSLSAFSKLEKIFSEIPRMLKRNYLERKINKISFKYFKDEKIKELLTFYENIYTLLNQYINNNDAVIRIINLNEISILFAENEEKNKILKSHITELMVYNRKCRLYLDFILINNENQHIHGHLSHLINENSFLTLDELKNIAEYLKRSHALTNDNIYHLIINNYQIYANKITPVINDNKILLSSLFDIMENVNEFLSLETNKNEIELNYNINNKLNIYQFEQELLFLLPSDNNCIFSLLGVSDIVEDLFVEPEGVYSDNINIENISSTLNMMENEKNKMDIDENNADDKKISIETLFESIGKLENLIEATSFDEDNFDKRISKTRKIFITFKNLIDVIHSLLKLTNLSVSIFYNLSVNGFCEAEKPKFSDSSDDKGGIYEGGMGMADAQGVEDVSKEIEDEEQLLGLKEENKNDMNDQNNKNKNEKKDKNSGFETKNDFNGDEKLEFSDVEEDEQNESMDNSNVEREKDKVDKADNNKMYDKDNEIKDENDKKNENDDNSKEENSNVDLTNKNLEVENNSKDNNYKAKDETKSNTKKGKQVDKPDEPVNQEENINDNVDEENEKVEKQDNKIEELDIDDSYDGNNNDKKEDEQKSDEEDVKSENSAESRKEDGVDNDKVDEMFQKEMDEINNNQNSENKNDSNENNKQDENKENGLEDFGKDDLLGDGPVQNLEDENMMDIDNEINENNEELIEEDNNQEELPEPVQEDIGMNEEKPIDEEVKKEEQESLFKSNPLPTDKGDLGYNPISNKMGSKGNTAKESKEQNKKNEKEAGKDESKQNNETIEENKDRNINDIDKYEETLDLNAMLESVWLSRPSAKKNSQKDSNNTNPGDNKNSIENLDDITEKQKENIKENFDFKDYQNDSNEKDTEMNYEAGFADNNKSENKENDLARGFDKNKNEKSDQNPNTKKGENIEIDQNKDQPNKDKTFNKEMEKIDSTKVKDDLDTNNSQKIKEEALEENSENDEMDIDEENQLFEDIESNENKKHEELMTIDDYMKMNLNNENKTRNIQRFISLDDNNIYENGDEKLQEEPQDSDNIQNIKQSETEMIQDFQCWTSNSVSTDFEFNMQLWNKLEQLSINNINKLTEQLKIVFEPNKQTKLRGNYKSGKRLNIKKIISFIASNYRNDKIWLRRTLPHERNYYVMLAIDDSLSMKEHNLGFFALESLVIVSTALNKVFFIYVLLT